jgi:hypothetical protein
MLGLDRRATRDWNRDRTIKAPIRRLENQTESSDAQRPMLRSAAIGVVSPADIDGQASDERRSVSLTTRIRKKGWTHSTHTDSRPHIGNFTVMPTPAQRGHSMQRLHLTSNRPVSALVASTSIGLMDGQVGIERRAATVQNGVVRSLDGNPKSPRIAYPQGVQVHPMAVVNEEVHIGGCFVSNLCQTNGVKSTRIEASSRR